MEENEKISEEFVRLAGRMLGGGKPLEAREEPGFWETLMARKNECAEFFAKLGLDLCIDEKFEYACLLMKKDEDTGEPLAKGLVRRKPIGRLETAMLIEARQRLYAFDYDLSQTMAKDALVDADELKDAVRKYNKKNADEFKDDANISRAIENLRGWGFLVPVSSDVKSSCYRISRAVEKMLDLDAITDLSQRINNIIS